MPRSRQISSRGPGYRLRGIHGRVVSSIGEGIIKGRYPAGSLLPREPELIAKFDVSRTALREALKVLAAKGLVETRQRVGTRVRPQEQWNHFDPEITAWQLGNGFRNGFVRDLIEFRQINEPAAARLAAKRATAKDLAAIAAALAGMQDGAVAEDALAYAEADARFHICVFLASHNNLMASLSFTIRQILETTFKLHQVTKGARSYGYAEDLAFHRRVFEKIGRRQPEAAASAMSQLVAAAEHDLKLMKRRRRG
jgi:GntR family transcriptional regulator, galactonate operon transcriptional repressor